MTAVVLSRKLTLLLEQTEGPDAPLAFAQRFQQWRKGELEPGEVFGKDTPFIKPKAVVEVGLRHVHLETPQKRWRWNQLADEGEEDRNAYVSDKILAYAHMDDLQHQPYMLLLILQPGHAFMQDPKAVGRLADFYEDERYDFVRRVAADPWITVGI